MCFSSSICFTLEPGVGELLTIEVYKFPFIYKFLLFLAQFQIIAEYDMSLYLIHFHRSIFCVNKGVPGKKNRVHCHFDHYNL
jgi:hypothetical protein